MTSSRLRELSRLASPAPWFAEKMPYSLFDKGRLVPVITLGTHDAIHVVTPDTEKDDYANAELLVSLRNDAEKYADLRDAAKEMLEALSDTRYHGIELGALGDPMRSLRAALAALGGEE